MVHLGGWIYIGSLTPPSNCNKYYTYTSKQTCKYAKSIGIQPWPPDLVYKDLKTLLCRMWREKFTVKLETEDEYEEVVATSCELIMGKRGRWSSSVALLYNKGTVNVYLDAIQYDNIKILTENPPSEEEVIDRLKNALEKLKQIYSA